MTSPLWLDAETSASAPAGLHAEAIQQARHARQRPGWLVALRGGTIAGPSVARLDRRTMLVLAGLGLLLAGLLAAIVIGSHTVDRSRLGGNGSVAFTFQGNNHGPGGTVVVTSDGSNRQQRGAAPGSCPTYSRDGTMMAAVFGEGASTDIALLANAAGGIRHVPAPSVDTFWHPHFGSYALSSDSRRIAWLKSLDPTLEPPSLELWVSRVEDGVGTRVLPAPSDASVIYGIPVWSPDGRSVAYETRIVRPDGGYGGRSGISVLAVDTGEVLQVSSRAGIGLADLSWSPDGQYLAFIGQPDGVSIPTVDPDAQAPDPRTAGDVFVVRSNGTDERNITTSSAFEQGAAWSPDGARLGYLSSEDGETYRLTTVAMDGPDAVAEPAYGPASEFLVWSPDATQLLWTGSGRVVTGTGTLSTISTIDRDLAGPLTVVAQVEGTLLCAPSWQPVFP